MVLLVRGGSASERLWRGDGGVLALAESRILLRGCRLLAGSFGASSSMPETRFPDMGGDDRGAFPMDSTLANMVMRGCNTKRK